MKIRSAVPENGCLIFLADGKKSICKTYTLPPHRRLHKLLSGYREHWQVWEVGLSSAVESVSATLAHSGLSAVNCLSHPLAIYTHRQLNITASLQHSFHFTWLTEICCYGLHMHRTHWTYMELAVCRYQYSGCLQLWKTWKTRGIFNLLREFL